MVTVQSIRHFWLWIHSLTVPSPPLSTPFPLFVDCDSRRDYHLINVEHSEPGTLRLTHPEGAAVVHTRLETECLWSRSSSPDLLMSSYHSTNSHLLVGFTVIICQI